MKVSIQVPSSKQVSRFPCLRQNVVTEKGEHYIVYFMNETAGVVIHAEKNSPWPEGYYDSEWANYNDKSIWKEFCGKIVIENP